MRQRPVPQPPRDDDATLIERAKEATSAFGELYLKYVRGIYRYVFERVGKSAEVAEDITQDIFIRAWRGIGRFADRGYSYGTYLTTIARNLLVNHYRRRRDAAPLDEVEAVLSGPLAERPEHAFLIERFWDSLGALTPAEREAVTLHYRDELLVSAIAERLGKSENSVKISLSRARKKLAERPELRDAFEVLSSRDTARSSRSKRREDE